jgi:SAM-dependent methyltransferase
MSRCSSPLPDGPLLDVESRLTQVAALLRDHRDIVQGRVNQPTVPLWCAGRGWSEFLLSLSEEALVQCEADGFVDLLRRRGDAPSSLVSVMEQVRAASDIPSIGPVEPALGLETHRVKARKQAQLGGLLSLAQNLAEGANRIVDVGAGQGHLTRAAARAWDKEAVGLDRNEALIRVARLLAEDGRVDFQFWDAFGDPFDLCESDLVVGLHACGEVGDVLVQRASESGARVLLVSCCPQKVRGEVREPVSRSGRDMGLQLPRGVLGLANLSQLTQGVEASLTDTMRSRQARYALRLLLRGQGCTVSPGAEMRGVNRRQAYHGLRSLAEQALSARGLPLATPAEIETFEQHARLEYGVMRRLSLPRAAFARLVELAVVLDRAALLRERDYSVSVATVFDATVSPRNIGIFALPDPVGRACR